MVKNDDKRVIKSQYRVEYLLEEDVLAFHYEARHVVSKELIRVIQYKEEFLTPRVIRRLIEVSERLASLSNPHVVPLHDYHYDGRDFYVMYSVHDALAPLQSLLTKDPKPKVELLWSLSMQLLSVMMDCEKQKLPVGLTLRHLYVDREKSLRVMGIAHHVELLREWFPDLSAFEDALCLAPEFVQKQVYAIQSDIYAYGVVLYVLFSRRWPYSHTIKLDELKKVLLTPVRPFKAAYQDVPDSLADVIVICLQKDPQRRFTGFHDLIATYQGETTATATLAKQIQSEEAPAVKAIEKSLKMAHRKKWLTRLQFALLAGVIVVFGLLGYQHYVNYLTGIPDVTVPPIVGLEQQEANLFLRSRHLNMVVAGERFHPTVPTGHVLETKPPVGRTVKLNRPIRVFLSKGPMQLMVPHLVGRTLDQAQSMLIAHGDRIEVVEEAYSIDYDPGVILAQVPTPNTFLGVSDNIELTVSKGFPVSVRVEETKSFFFRKKDTFRRVLVQFSVLPDWEPQTLTLFFEFNGQREKLHDRSYGSGTQKTMSYELELGGVLMVYANDELVYQDSIKDPVD